MRGIGPPAILGHALGTVPPAEHGPTTAADTNEVAASPMNDLAERALHGLDVARKQIGARPVPSLSMGGFAAAAMVVVAGGRIGAAPATIPLSTWLGLLPRGANRRDTVPEFVMLGGIAALVALWLVALRVLPARANTDRQVWTVAAAWSLPFIVGPPLLGTAVYSSVARGLLARVGLDPYTHGPSSLGGARIVNAISPNWRSAPSTGGPLSALTEHLAVAISGGSSLGAVILLRALAVASLVAIGLLAADLAEPRRAGALCMTVLNPALLLYVVSGARLEGLLGALLLGALVAAGQRRWLVAILLACAAAGVKPVALVAIPAIIAIHALGHRAHVAWRIAAHDVVWTVGSLAVFTLIVSDGLGWSRNLSTTTREHTPFAPASLISDLISPIVPSASFDDLAVGGRIAVILAAATGMIYLLSTVRVRPLDQTVGFALLTIGLLGPVLYPWYLLWGLICLAPASLRARRDWVVALSVAACVLTPAGFADNTGKLVTAAGLALVSCVLIPRLVLRRRTQMTERRIRAPD